MLVARVVGDDVDDDTQALSLGLDRLHGPDPVDMPLDDVSTHRVTCSQGGLEIDRRAGGQLTECRSAERLGDSVKEQAAVSGGLGREADAVDRDGAADLDERSRAWGLDLEPHPLGAAGDGGDDADLANDPGEHDREGYRGLYGSWM